MGFYWDRGLDLDQGLTIAQYLYDISAGVQLALAEAQSQLPHSARAGVTGIMPEPELPQDPTAAHAGAAQRRTIEDLLVTIILSQ